MKEVRAQFLPRFIMLSPQTRARTSQAFVTSVAESIHGSKQLDFLDLTHTYSSSHPCLFVLCRQYADSLCNLWIPTCFPFKTLHSLIFNGRYATVVHVHKQNHWISDPHTGVHTCEAFQKSALVWVFLFACFFFSHAESVQTLHIHIQQELTQQV